ncbi:CLUMA_CG010905, isoform A [Clunio marinus]|uniref:CLUMA_CG010905, isoform A n=1 Tax=Clunio marinus TaxID=568069 RepID=A0A1J1ID84_9DIPT|nr:CLUMA_CG010905, isoform A [Clunio marinus]
MSTPQQHKKLSLFQQSTIILLNTALFLPHTREKINFILNELYSKIMTNSDSLEYGFPKKTSLGLPN